MEKSIYKIWEKDELVTLTIYMPELEQDDKPALIVIPGGAYIAPSWKEADPVAQRFAEMGYLGCVLRASTMYKDFEDNSGEPNEHTIFPEPLYEVGAAILFLRRNRERLGIAENRIALCGFSAGGHLTANYCNYWNRPDIAAALGASAEELRPNGNILGYAATYLSSRVKGAMLRAVFGERSHIPQEEVDEYNPKYHIDRCTPPTFIWHTANDTMVPVKHSYDMALALSEEGVPHGVHIFSRGPHASGLASGMPAEDWPVLADRFLKAYMH